MEKFYSILFHVYLSGNLSADTFLDEDHELISSAVQSRLRSFPSYHRLMAKFHHVSLVSPILL